MGKFQRGRGGNRRHRTCKCAARFGGGSQQQAAAAEQRETASRGALSLWILGQANQEHLGVLRPSPGEGSRAPGGRFKVAPRQDPPEPRPSFPLALFAQGPLKAVAAARGR